MNTKIQDRKAEYVYLNELKSDLVSDTITLRNALGAIEYHGSSAEYVLDYIEKDFSIDTMYLIRSLTGAGFMYFFNPNMSTYNDLISTGNIKLIQDEIILEMLDTYHNRLRQIRERQEVTKQIVWFDYQAYYRTEYMDGRLDIFANDADDSSLRKYPIDFKRMRKDPKLAKLLSSVFGSARAERRWHFELLSHLKETIDHLVGLIEETPSKHRRE